MIRVQTTARCIRTPDVVMALEELAVPYELELKDDGFFTATYGRMGPRLVDGETAVFEPAAIIRHLARQHAALGEADARRADEWMDFAISQLRPAAARLGMQKMSPGGGIASVIDQESGRLMGALKVIDQGLGDREFLLGGFTLVDCSFVLLTKLPLMGIDLSSLAALSAYRERLLARPSWSRMMARCTG